MILVLGGIASGKRTFIKSLGYTEAHMDMAKLGAAPVLYGLDELLRAGPLDATALDAVAGKDVVACREVALGVVPAQASERVWRELVGRTCAQLAQRAHIVVRMVCGIPVAIKGCLEDADGAPDGQG